MSETKKDGPTEGYQTLEKEHLHGESDPKRAEYEKYYKGGYAGPNSGGPADKQKDE